MNTRTSGVVVLPSVTDILFTLNCFILWNTIQWHKNYQFKYIFRLAFFIGLAAICRPVELIWLIVPMLWNVKNPNCFEFKTEKMLIHPVDFTFEVLKEVREKLNEEFY